MRFNPIYSLIAYILYRLTGRVHLDFPDVEVRIFRDKSFEVCGHLLVDRAKRGSTSVFWIRFTLPEGVLTDEVERVELRRLPLDAGLAGLREKYWCIHRSTNEYLGLYEWTPWERARDYSRSSAIRRAHRLAVANSVHYGVIPRFTLKRLLREEDLISFNPYRTTA